MNYKLLAVMILTAVTTFMIIVTVINFTGMLNEIPTEEKCQSIYGYGMEEKKYAERYFCEFNETGWHLNKTKFKEALGKAENWAT